MGGCEIGFTEHLKWAPLLPPFYRRRNWERNLARVAQWLSGRAGRGAWAVNCESDGAFRRKALFKGCTAGLWLGAKEAEMSTIHSYRKWTLNIHWKDWCWSRSSSPLVTWCEELTHSKRPWCWERLKAGGEGDNQRMRWLGGITDLTGWVWASSRRWWRTGKPGGLQFMGSQSRTRLSTWTTTKCLVKEKYLHFDLCQLVPSAAARPVCDLSFPRCWLPAHGRGLSLPSSRKKEGSGIMVCGCDPLLHHMLELSLHTLYLI